MPVRGNWFADDCAFVADVTSAIVLGIGVEGLAIRTRARYAHAIAIADNRRRVRGHQNERSVARAPEKRQDAARAVVAIDPPESLRILIEFVQRRRGAVEAIAVAHQARNSRVQGVVAN